MGSYGVDLWFLCQPRVAGSNPVEPANQSLRSEGVGVIPFELALFSSRFSSFDLKNRTYWWQGMPCDSWQELMLIPTAAGRRD